LLEINRKVREVQGCRPDSLSDDILYSAEPLVLRGLTADWPLVEAAKQSSAKAESYILEFDSGQPLTAYRGPGDINGRIFYNHDLSGFNFERIRLPLTEVFENLRQYSSEAQPPTLYVGSTMVDNWLPEMRRDNDLKLEGHDPLVSIWIGNRSRIAAHYDFPTNIACSVAGRRRFTLFPPEQLENLYVGPIDFTPAGQSISMVDFDNPDYVVHPKFREALKAAQVVELEPGDAILIPSMWWHHVESLDDLNILVNYWWRNTPAYMGTPVNVLQHAIMGIRELPPEQRAAWREVFDHYVFKADDKNYQHIPEGARGVLNPLDEVTARDIRNLLLNKFKR
tara:strand:+ start:1043 stop:2056 length:1014 start_codon:yes stop_codon:yes gene_type:complete